MTSCNAFSPVFCAIEFGLSGMNKLPITPETPPNDRKRVRYAGQSSCGDDVRKKFKTPADVDETAVQLEEVVRLRAEIVTLRGQVGELELKVEELEELELKVEELKKYTKRLSRTTGELAPARSAALPTKL